MVDCDVDCPIEFSDDVDPLFGLIILSGPVALLKTPKLYGRVDPLPGLIELADEDEDDEEDEVEDVE